MHHLSINHSTYLSPEVRVHPLARALPSLSFLPLFLGTVFRSATKARRGEYDPATWQASSIDVLRGLEAVGVEVRVEGLEHLRAAAGPVVIIGNHLSVMETVVLPAFILAYKRFTYVIKTSLLKVPVFKHVMRSLEPIAVTRKNPRQDLKVVLDEGSERLSRQISLMIFPQTTRSAFAPEQFSTIGIKLARRAGVQIVPLALLTDAWQTGRVIKDFGPIVPSRTVHFAFGSPLDVAGRGTEEHRQVIDFIQHHLAAWEAERAAPAGG